MKKIILIICLIVFFACQDKSENNGGQIDNQNIHEKEAEINIVGLWQALPFVASGWDDTYQFFEDGKFTFNYNQMICDKREYSYSGNWEFDSEIIKLTVNERVIHEGGELVPAMGSCASEYEIEGGEIKTIILDEPEIIQVRVSDYGIDEENMEMQTIKFDNIQFWKIGSNPDIY
ncbi:MAG: hypothetical protein JW866_11355 [Ignavibacteriales bacterium]|nr:hypothetical protein [Ignavibacteriales bacterium]